MNSLQKNQIEDECQLLSSHVTWKKKVPQVPPGGLGGEFYKNFGIFFLLKISLMELSCYEFLGLEGACT